MNKLKLFELAVELTAAEIASGRIHQSLDEQFDETLKKRLLIHYGQVEDLANTLGVFQTRD